MTTNQASAMVGAAPAGGQNLGPSLSRLRHDLRTPVNAIIGYGEMLVEDAPPHLTAALHRLPELGKQLLVLINSTLEAGAVDVTDPQLDMRAIGLRARDQLQGPARQVVAVCEQLLEKHGAAELASLRPDLLRVREAGERLLGMLAEALAVPAANAAVAPTLCPEGRPLHSPRPVVADAPAEIRGHLLLVDDNDFNRDILGRAVRRQGHTFTEAADGAQALTLIQPTGFDLVLLDIQMPGMNGLEVLQRLKADERLRHIPVIMISAQDEIDTVVRCIEMGAVDFLPKPFDPVLLKARVGASLEKKRLRDQELEYLRNVEVITQAAAAVEAGKFEPGRLAAVSGRTDALGQLARVFQTMAQVVHAREERLKQQVEQLRVEIDHTRKTKQVEEVTESVYFQDLKKKIDALRKRKDRGG
ncbi:MAG: response regulator [Planctomycetia bacterium]|nr:response regulator [Planctomycetia bacterium]